MGQLVVRNLDETIKASLRLRASRHGHSMEEEVRNILSSAAGENADSPKKLGTWFANTFASVGLKKPIEEHRGHSVNPASFG